MPARMLITFLVTAGVLLLGAVPAVGATQREAPLTLRFTTTGGSVTTVDLGPAGKSPGDMYVFEGRLLSRGKRVGHVYGSQTSIRLEPGREIVHGVLTFRLRGGDSLLISGLSAYPRNSNSGIVVGEQFARAVIGGTGRYAGARGTLTSTRRGGNSYLHVVRLLA